MTFAIVGRCGVALYSITIFFPTMHLHNIVPARAACAAKFQDAILFTWVIM